MRKRLVFSAVLYAILLLTSCEAGAERGSEFYPQTAAVVSLDEDEDVVTVQSAEGILWSFYGCSDYALNDVVSLLMEANDTPEISDDKIVQSRYAGYSLHEFSRPDDRIQTVSGRFYYAAEMEDLEGNRGMLYQFRSDDDAVWWLLSEEEMGFVPQLLEQQYLLTFDNHGTTPESKGCDCPPEYECECEFYDDEFLSISPVVTIEPILQIY